MISPVSVMILYPSFCHWFGMISKVFQLLMSGFVGMQNAKHMHCRPASRDKEGR